MSLGIDVSRETEKKVAIPVIALTRVTLLVCGNGHPICLFFSAFPEHQDTWHVSAFKQKICVLTLNYSQTEKTIGTGYGNF